MSRSRLALTLIGVSLPMGVVAGLLWWWWAPRVVLEVRGEVAVPEGFQPEEFLGSDVTLALLLGACGLIVGIVGVWRARDRPLVVLMGGVVGGLVGSVIAWALGTWLGRVDVAALTAAGPDGATFEAALRMRMPGVLLLWPVMVASVVTVVALWDAVIAWQEGRDDPEALPGPDDENDPGAPESPAPAAPGPDAPSR